MKKVLLSFSAALLAVSAYAQVPKNGFIEEFTSSTCPPCDYFNEFYDPYLQEVNANGTGSKYIAIRYQMNWPSPNNDPSYNAHGATRRTYYGVSGIPQHWVNGKKGLAFNAPKPDLKAELLAATSASTTTNIDITGTYFVKSDSIFISVKVDPKATISGNHKVFVAATNSFYKYPGASTNQVDYYHVMRKMFPNGGGTAEATGFTANTPKTYTFSDKYTVKTTPTQGSFDFWKSPYEGHIIAFVQHVTDSTVLQAVAIPAKWATSVEDMNTINKVSVYPNPATDQVSVSFNLDKGRKVVVNVFDEVGRVVARQPEADLAAGAHTITVPTSNLSTGNYYIRIQSEAVAEVARFTVIK